MRARPFRPHPLVSLAWIPLAFLVLRAPIDAQSTRRFAGQTAVPLRLESPPMHPPAAPCGGSCAMGGASPRGIPNVYLDSGELHLEQVDLVIPGRGMDFVWTRTYRSRNGIDTAQGHGWVHSYDIRVTPDAAGVRVMDGGGRDDLYRMRPDGTYVAPGLFREGRFEPDGSFVLVFADTGTWTFFPLDGSPQEGEISAITDRNGNAIVFEYDLQGRLSLVVDTLARGIQVLYRPDGRIGSLVDFTGREVVYDYYTGPSIGGGAGDLRSVRSPVVVGTPNGNDFPSGKTTTYTYSRGFGDERLNHNLLRVTDPNGHTWMINEYGNPADPRDVAFDRLVRQRRGDPDDVIDIDYSVVPETPTHPEDPVVPAWPIVPKVLATVNDRVGNVSDYLFDERGHCIRLRQYTGRANPDMPTTPTGNRPRNPLRTEDPPFFETRWEHNADSLVTRVIRPNGNETRSTYELELDPMADWRSRGNLRELHMLPGTHTPVGNQAELVETFEYETGFGGCCGTNFVTRHVDARGNATEHDYDSSGNLLQTRHRIPSIVEDFTYNQYGQMTSHTLPDNGSGWRRRDEWTYYGASSGPQRGYLATKTIDALGAHYTTVFVRDSRGNAIQILDPRNSLHTVVVNELDQVVRRTSPAVQLLDGSTVQYRIDTSYDADDNVVTSAITNIDDQGVMQPNGTLTTSFEYEALNKIVRRVQEVDAGADVVTEYEYDANRNLTLARRGEAVNGNQPANVVRTLFDERDHPFRRIAGEGSAEESTTQYDYDGNGNVYRTTAGLGSSAERETTTVYDAYGRDVMRVDAMGNEALSDYDENGNLVRWRFLGEVCDVPGSAGNVLLSDATHVYDPMDRLVQTVQQHFDPVTQLPLGDGLSVAAWTWTDRSERASATDDDGNTTGFAYDGVGRLLRTTDARGNYVELAYDGNDNVVQRTEAELSDVTGAMTTYVTTCAYDEVDRLVRETDPAGDQTRLGYDSRSNLTRLVDGLGNVTVRTFDGLGRLTSAERMLTDTGTGGGGVIGSIARSWAWDDSSRLVAQTDPNGNVTTYVYDALDRRTGTTCADGTTEALAYDAHDEVVFRLDPNGTQVTSTYDADGRLSGRAIAPGPGVSSDTSFETWKHDGFGRLVLAQDDDSVVERTWDSLGLCSSESQDGRVFTWVHDGAGNAVQVTYPGGKVVHRTFDALNRVSSITNMGPAASYEYVGPTRVERRTTGGGVVASTYMYDAARRVTSVAHQRPGSAAFDRRVYAWDGAWNKVSGFDVVAGTTSTYSYDSQYRLVEAQVVDGVGATLRDTSYSFDPAGNRTGVTGGSCAGAYTMDPTLPEPADSQMNQYTSTPCIGCIEYDANGNEVLRNNQFGYVRDWRDRIVGQTVLAGAGSPATYTYDALGRRRTKTDPGGTTEYLYAGRNVVEERRMGAVTATYVRGPGGEIVERTTQPGGVVHYYFADDLGSTRAVTDSAGNVVERYDYGDYGMPMFLSPGGGAMSSSAIGNAWLFTGRLHDAESGLYLCGARQLDPLTGRFVARDPLGVWGDPTNVGVGSTYAGNNPQTLVDTTGLFSARAECGNGPWPGALHVYYERIDCGLDTRIPNSLCAAKIGAGRAMRDYRRWASLVAEGPPGNKLARTFALIARNRFLRWFGGPDGKVDGFQMGRIGQVLGAVWEPFEKGLEIPVECEGSCDGGVNAYSAGYDCSLHLCPPWFATGMNNLRRAAILLHEMTHEYGGLPQDTFYYQQAQSPNGSILLDAGFPAPSNPFGSNVLVKNSDTYEEFYFEHHVSTR